MIPSSADDAAPGTDALIRRRHAAGLTIAGLARAAGVDRAVIERWEAGDAPPPDEAARVLVALADVERAGTTMGTLPAPERTTITLGSLPGVTVVVHADDTVAASTVSRLATEIRRGAFIVAATVEGSPR